MAQRAFSVFIGNLPTQVTKGELEKLFGGYGEISGSHINPSTLGRDTTLSTFGFVRFKSLSGAERAVKALNGWPIMGKTLQVSFSNETLQYVREGGGEVTHRGQRPSQPEDHDHMARLLGLLDELNDSAASDSERVDRTLLLNAIYEQPNELYPTFHISELPSGADFTALDALMGFSEET